MTTNWVGWMFSAIVLLLLPAVIFQVRLDPVRFPVIFTIVGRSSCVRDEARFLRYYVDFSDRIGYDPLVKSMEAEDEEE